MILRLLPVAAVLLAWPAAAQAPPGAADRPFVVPQRDVDVVYVVPMPGGPGMPAAGITQRVRFSVAPARQRVDPPGPGTYMITDYDARRLTVVQPARRLATVLPAPGDPVTAHGTRAAGGYRRLGPQHVAATACTDWAVADGSGRPSIVCLTDDGVMLRASQGGHLLLEAVQVAYGPQDPALFAIPAGYRLQVPPGQSGRDGPGP